MRFQLVGMAFSILCAISSGCATGYLSDRCRDGADMFTFAVGPGSGVDARVGPLSVGLGHFHDKAGLECGELFLRHHSRGGPEHLVWFGKFQNDLIPLPFVSGHKTTETKYPDDPGFKTAEARHKVYETGSILVVPMFEYPKEKGFSFAKLHAVTQVEMAVGAFGSVRVGFNPLEIVDFVLGWTTIDIFNDDIERRENRTTKSTVPSEGAPSDVQ